MEISDFDKRAGDQKLLCEYVLTLKTKEQHDALTKELFKRLTEVAFIYNSMFNASCSSKVYMLVINAEVDGALHTLLRWRDWNEDPSVGDLVIIGGVNLKARQNLLILQELYGFFIP